MKRKLTHLMLIFTTIFILTSCGNYSHVPSGTFYSLTEAYAEQLLTVEHLATIKGALFSVQPAPDAEIATMIKKDYHASLPLKDNNKPLVPYRDVFISKYYGSYNDSHVVVMSYTNEVVPAIGIIEIVAGIEFHYGLPAIQVWHQGEKKTTSSQTEELKSITLMMNFDYGVHIENEATLLIGGSLLFFNPLDYGIERLFAGDLVTINYTGTFLIQEMYPSVVVTSNLVIKSVEVMPATVVPFEILNIPGGGIDLVALDPQYQSGFTLATRNVIAADLMYKPWDNYPVNTKIYGVYQPASRTNEIIALYAVNPLL